MDTDQYDIFLSYRRESDFATARLLYDWLTRDGYSVSFDIETLRQGDFDTALLRRVDQCKDFIQILNKEAFDRMLDPAFDRKDWLRIELARALEKDKNVIPVMLGGFTEFPDNLPEDIARVRRKNGPKYDQYYFDAFYKKLQLFLDSRPSERGCVAPSGGGATGSSTLKVRCDTDCRIFVDEEERGIARTGQLFRLSLRGGSYFLRFESVENPADTVEERYRIEKDVEDLYSVALLPVKQQREEREAVARAEAAARAEEEKRQRRETYLLQLPDKRFKIARGDGDAYGFVDSENHELLIPFIYYDSAWPFSEGLARVEKDVKWGYIDKTGKEAIPLIYDMVYDFSEGLAPVKKNGKWGYIDKTGKIAIPFIYDWADVFSGGLARIKKDEKWGFIDKTGKVAIPLIYDYAVPFNEGLAQVKKNGKRGFIDKTGKVAIPFIYDDVNSFSEGLAAVEKDGKYGFIDKTGKMVIPAIYGDAEDFSEGLTPVRKDGKYGFIDKTGKVVISFIYDNAGSFYYGLAAVNKDGKRGYIDKTGRWVRDKD